MQSKLNEPGDWDDPSMAGAMPAATANGANLAQTPVRAAQKSDDSAA